MRSKGAVELERVCREQGGQHKVAERIGAHQPMISKWLACAASPSAQNRAALEDAYGIGWRLWDEESEEQVPDTERPQ